MPLFEFKCKSCGKKFTALVGVLADSTPPGCPACGGTDLAKLVSRFSAVRSEDDILESMADPNKYGDLDDPSNVRKLVKEMGKELGEDMGEDLEQLLEEGSEGGGGDDAIY
jgi:putative FmdB family regulatory protein